jgi:hypothetical protein
MSVPALIFNRSFNNVGSSPSFLNRLFDNVGSSPSSFNRSYDNSPFHSLVSFSLSFPFSLSLLTSHLPPFVSLFHLSLSSLSLSRLLLSPSLSQTEFYAAFKSVFSSVIHNFRSSMVMDVDVNMD